MPNKSAKKIKGLICRIVLYFLARGFKAGYMFDEDVKHEFDRLPENYTILIKSSIKGPNLYLKKTSGGIERCKLNADDNVDLILSFKCIESAFKVFLGQMSVATAYAQHRVTVKGDIADTVSLVICVNLIENYLFPKFITSKIFDILPIKKVSSVKFYRYVLFGF